MNTGKGKGGLKEGKRRKNGEKGRMRVLKKPYINYTAFRKKEDKASKVSEKKKRKTGRDGERKRETQS